MVRVFSRKRFTGPTLRSLVRALVAPVSGLCPPLPFVDRLMHLAHNRTRLLFMSGWRSSMRELHGTLIALLVAPLLLTAPPGGANSPPVSRARRARRWRGT